MHKGVQQPVIARSDNDEAISGMMGGQACKDEIAAPRQGGARNDNKGFARNDRKLRACHDNRPRFTVNMTATKWTKNTSLRGALVPKQSRG